MTTEFFRHFAQKCSVSMGTPLAFFAAVTIVVGWAVTGPVFHYSDTWQLVINTGTTVITFLMVFVIQSSQNRDSMVIQLKLDELLRALQDARTDLVNLEQWSDEDLRKLQKEFERLNLGERKTLKIEKKRQH